MKNNFTERRTSDGDRRKSPLLTVESQRLFQIMVVSEDHSPAEQLTLRLKNKGYQSVICTGLSESHCFNEKHPDVIVICCDKECEKIKNQLKTDDYLAKTPVILLKDEKPKKIKKVMQEPFWTDDTVFENLEDQLRSILVNKLNPGIDSHSIERRKCDRRWPSVFQPTSNNEKTQQLAGVPETSPGLPLVSISSQFSFKSVNDLFSLVLVSLHPVLYQNWLTQLSWDTFISASSLRLDRAELIPIMLNHAQPNLLLLDMQGLESSSDLWINAIRMADSPVDIILIVNEDFHDFTEVMAKHEISGILSAKDNACTVTRAIRSVIEGERWLPERFKTKRINESKADNQTVNTTDKWNLSQHSFDEATLLTAYENTITQLVMMGLTIEQIAEELNAETQAITRQVMFLSNKLRFNNSQIKIKQLRRKLH
ncbi:hypothetical protein GO003_017590 [Methylicorpusculum oleiharenae]|uniref:hypothetical protein n=1 Tax=Methylicorpusculum oleiharenae TaxID=1338687 RepID=UPI0013596D0A|nr:hypothetical protein [Methylicorpusculum oleiharenae]MCD2452204.1 hypothetical protein [Methylicorpusculum oleiharenae]